MDTERRVILRGAGAGGVMAAALAAGLLKPERVLAASWNKDAFMAKSAGDALQKIGAGNATESKDVVIEAPQIAENGAVVPIEVTSNVAGTSSISVLIEKNPFPMTGMFEFKEGAMPFVKLNVKMGESSVVRVVAQAGGKSYVAMREVKVTIGGCGG